MGQGVAVVNRVRWEHSNPGEQERRWEWVIGLCCLTVLVVACFGAVLFGGRQFAFRDSAHFYYPLYLRVQQEWTAGRLPLWEPGANGGMPLLGSPMAAVLYPFKILFALVPYSWGAKLYIVAHDVLAFGAMRALARHWGVSRTGSTMAGLCYAFGGPVLSDYFNVIYLVGAAWAPLGFRAADRWMRLGRRSALIELTLVLAMQVLGGDPQAAYVTVLCAFGYAIGMARARKPFAGWPSLWGIGLLVTLVGWTRIGPAVASRIHGSGGRMSQAILAAAWAVGILAYVASRPRSQRSRLATMLVGLAASVALGLALTGAQLLPVLDHIARSVRWEGPGPVDFYDSSLLPYRMAEWVWPNVFGTFFNGNHYWMALLPPADSQRPWPLSLYMGALPLILAFGAAGFRNGSPWRAWMTIVAVVTFTASLGEFAGPARWSSAGPSPTAGDDSFLGLLAASLPGLRLFRLPFKLLVFTNLAMAALAGIGWDRLAAGVGRRKVITFATGLLALTVLVLIASVIQRDRIATAMASAPQSTSSVFGPLDTRGAMNDLLFGLGQGAVQLTASLVVVVYCIRTPGRAGRVALVVLVADLVAANAPLVFSIPQDDFDRVPEVVRAIRDAERADPSPGPFRVHRLASWVPIGWSKAGSPGRLRELVDWELDTIQPGFGLLHGLSYVSTDESETGLADHERLFQSAFRPVDESIASVLGVAPGQPVVYYPRHAFDLWGARYFILPSFPGGWTSPDRGYAAFLDQTEMIYPEPSALEGPEHAEDRERWVSTKDVQIRRNKLAFPRAWVVHDARLIRPLDGSNPGSRDALVARLGSRDSSGGDNSLLPASDLRSLAYIETDDRESLAPYLPTTPTDTSESVAVRYEGSSRVVLEAHLRRPGIVVLADTYDSGWRLAIDGRPASVLRANLLMRAAAVGAGAHTLVYTYEPASVRLGGWVSAAGLIGILGLVLWARPFPDFLGKFMRLR
jgi:hypothetical protein